MWVLGLKGLNKVYYYYCQMCLNVYTFFLQ